MPQELPEGTVTVLFTDVVGSTDLGSRLGDEAAQEILRAQRELVRQQVEEHSGHEVRTLTEAFEPYLLRIGLLDVTERGRKLTVKGLPTISRKRPMQ